MEQLKKYLMTSIWDHFEKTVYRAENYSIEDLIRLYKKLGYDHFVIHYLTFDKDQDSMGHCYSELEIKKGLRALDHLNYIGIVGRGYVIKEFSELNFDIIILTFDGLKFLHDNELVKFSSQLIDDKILC